MDCREIREKGLMMDMVDAVLADAALVEEARRHIDGCASCKGELEGMKAVFGSLKQDAAAGRAADLDAGKIAGLAKSVRKEIEGSRQKARDRRSSIFKKLAPVAAVAVIVFAALMYNNGNKTTGGGDAGGSLPVKTAVTAVSADVITFDNDEIDEFFASSEGERYALAPGLGEKELDNVYADVRTMGRLLD